MFEFLTAAALIAAALAGGYALAQREHIKHLKETIAHERGGKGASTAEGAQRKQIVQGTFRDVEGSRA